MSKTVQRKKAIKVEPLVGTWASADEFDSAVEYVISSKESGFTVRAIDHDDEEEADIFEVKWNGEILSFAAYWNSTGRFTRCQMRAQSKDHVDLTYTYTGKALLHRKSH